MQNKLVLEVVAQTKEATKQIEQLRQEIKSFSNGIQESNRHLKQQENKLASLAKSVKGVIGAYAGFSALKSAIGVIADFQQSIAKLQAISGATGNDLKQLQAKAEELGKSTIFSASQVAEGMNYLAMAGYKTKDIMASIGDVLNLAAVGGTSLAQSADIASNILSGFGMKASETSRVVDIMTATITNANTNISELGEAMKYASPSAKALGVSIEETATAIGILSNAGIKGTMAGTGLAQVLTRLSAPTSGAEKAIQKLGIQIYDAEGNFLGLTNVLKQFKEKMQGLSEADKFNYISKIFGQEAAKTAITLIDNVGASYDKLHQKIVNSTGITSKKVKVMTDTFQAQMKALESAFQGLIITVGKELLPALTNFVKFLTTATSETAKFYSENKELINTITELATVFFGLRKLLTIFEALFGTEAITKIATLIASFKRLETAVEFLTLAFSKLSKANVALMALTAAITAMDYAFDKAEERINKTNKTTQELNDSTDKFRKILDTLQASMQNVGGVKTFRLTSEQIKELKEQTKALIEENKKKIATLKKDNDLSDEQRRILQSLISQNKNLENIYNRLQTIKPYEATKESAREAKQEVRKLTDAEIKELKKRVKEHTKVVETLEEKEQNLANRILQIQKQLQEKLKNLEKQRLNAIEDIELKIHDLKLAGASEYTKFVDKQKQADIMLAKAKEALREGDLAQARRYMSKYKSLISSIANHEIKEGKRVVVTKEQANKIAIQGYKKLENVTNEYYKKAKEQAKKLYLEKLQNTKAQLQATRTQLDLETQRLRIEKALIEAQTGQKYDIDVSGALNAIKLLDKQIKNVDEKIKRAKKLKVDADTGKAKQEIKEVTKERRTKLKVEADLSNANSKIVKIEGQFKKPKYFLISLKDNGAKTEIRKIDEEIAKKRGFEVYAKISDAVNSLKQIDTSISKKRAIEVDTKVNTKPLDNINKEIKKINTKFTIKLDTKKALGNVKALNTNIRRIKQTITIKADTRQANMAINMLVSKIKSIRPIIRVRADISGALNALHRIPRSITTIHYIRTVQRRATGGYIEPIRRSVGGVIQGHDLSGSDDVPALLTRGEYVLNVRAVDYYGRSFIEALNRMMIPKEFLKFSTGGLVDKSNVTATQARKIVDLNLNFGNRSFKMMTDEDIANALAEYLQRNEL